MTTFVGVDYGVRKLALAVLPEGKRRGPSGLFSYFWGTTYTPNDVLLAIDKVLADNFDYANLVDATVAIEYPFFAKNAKTSVRMGMMAGTLYSTLSYYSPRLDFVEPATWKKAIVGKGNATKEETMQFLRDTHPTWKFRNDDEADALCMAEYARRYRHG